jgi:DNA-binding NtrC family response regulator
MKKKVIFIVEDDPAFNKVLTSYLQAKNKWDVHSFSSGKECLEHLDQNPDIFLQDYDLPKMNGIEVMKKVKQKLPQTEFIFLSGQSDIKIAVDALQLGAFDYIVKDSHAKENAVNKIDQVMKIFQLIEFKRTQKKSQNILIGSLIVSWLLLFIVIFLLK